LPIITCETARGLPGVPAGLRAPGMNNSVHAGARFPVYQAVERQVCPAYSAQPFV